MLVLKALGRGEPGSSWLICGQKFENNISCDSKGVIEEFEIAKRMNKIIIPIGSTGFAAKYIYNIVRNDITNYPYLEPYIDLLGTETDIEILSKAIVHIILDVL